MCLRYPSPLSLLGRIFSPTPSSPDGDGGGMAAAVGVFHFSFIFLPSVNSTLGKTCRVPDEKHSENMTLLSLRLSCKVCVDRPDGCHRRSRRGAARGARGVGTDRYHSRSMLGPHGSSWRTRRWPPPLGHTQQLATCVASAPSSSTAAAPKADTSRGSPLRTWPQ